MNPWSLDYWKSGEYQVVREKLDDEVAKGFRINPERRQLFRALALVAETAVKAIIVGQDPYPDHRFATGVAFSIPSHFDGLEFPPTLRTVLTEYTTDLRYTMPSNGCLEGWCKQGVLLWNAIPSCREGSSLSHDWSSREWDHLTSEIIRRLSNRGVVFAFCGAIARRYAYIVDTQKNVVIETSHPSPRGSQNSRTPFVGSRLFSRINAGIVSLGMDPIDWRLDGSNQSEVSRPIVDGEHILPNLSGVPLPGLTTKSVRSPSYIGNFDVD